MTIDVGRDITFRIDGGDTAADRLPPANVGGRDASCEAFVRKHFAARSERFAKNIMWITDACLLAELIRGSQHVTSCSNHGKAQCDDSIHSLQSSLFSPPDVGNDGWVLTPQLQLKQGRASQPLLSHPNHDGYRRPWEPTTTS